MTEPRNEKNRTIRVMFNTKYKGKVQPQYMADFNMGFAPQTLTVREFAANIYRGSAFTPIFEGRRKKDNFVEAWHIALDFDTKDENSTFDKLSKEPLADYFAAFGYTTPSHTDEKPKCRLVFIFDKPITDRHKYEELYKTLLWNFPHADKAAKDALRLFYGSVKCQVWQNWSILPLPAIDKLIAQYRDHLESQKPPVKATVTVKPVNADKRAMKAIQTMLDNIANALDGEKHDTLRRMAFAIGGYVSGGYIDFSDALNMVYGAISRMSNVANVQSAEQTAYDAIDKGQAQPIVIQNEIGLLDVTRL